MPEIRRRYKACVEAWPECESFGYDPRCCRFPKSCSAEAGPDVPEEALEPLAPPVVHLNPPVPRYKLTVEVTGNTLDEVTDEIYGVGLNAPWTIGRRDECEIVGGTRTIRLQHTNPTQTPENYRAELDAWAKARKAARDA